MTKNKEDMGSARRRVLSDLQSGFANLDKDTGDAAPQSRAVRKIIGTENDGQGHSNDELGLNGGPGS